MKWCLNHQGNLGDRGNIVCSEAGAQRGNKSFFFNESASLSLISVQAFNFFRICPKDIWALEIFKENIAIFHRKISLMFLALGHQTYFSPNPYIPK